MKSIMNAAGRGVMTGVLAVLLLAMSASAVFAQVPDKFSNLKVLPRDIGKRELVDLMKDFTGALGMRCTDCHVERTPGDFASIDWASDELKNKETARGMMRMVREINGNLLPGATGEDDAAVSCVTCHRGVEHPRTLQQELLRTIETEGAEAGVGRYRQLRERYYGSGSYDFMPGTLTSLAGTLAQDLSDPAAARRMLELNLEMSPEHADSYLFLAQLDLTAGDKAAARANIDKALALQPDHGHAKRMLKQLEQ